MYASISELTREDGNGWDTGAGVAYGLAGMLAMMGGPAGWGAAAGLAAAGAISQTIGAFVRSSEALNQLRDCRVYIHGEWRIGKL